MACSTVDSLFRLSCKFGTRNAVPQSFSTYCRLRHLLHSLQMTLLVLSFWIVSASVSSSSTPVALFLRPPQLRLLFTFSKPRLVLRVQFLVPNVGMVGFDEFYKQVGFEFLYNLPVFSLSFRRPYRSAPRYSGLCHFPGAGAAALVDGSSVFLDYLSIFLSTLLCASSSALFP